MMKMIAFTLDGIIDSKVGAISLFVVSVISIFGATLLIAIPTNSQEVNGIDNANYSNVPITIDNANEVKLLETLTDHLDQVWTVTFSPNGKLLASCGQDGKVLVRNIDSISTSHQMGSFPYWIVGLAFSPDGNYLAYGGSQGFSSSVGPIGLWNIAADSLERVMDAHGSGVWSLDFQESTGILVSGSFDGTVMLWDPLTGTLLNTLFGHTAPVLSVDFNPNQNLIASSGIDLTIRLWDSQTGNPVRTLTGHTGNIGYVKFSPDGLTVASSADDGTVRLWNVADGSQIWSVNAGQGWVNCVNFNPDGTLLVTCGHNGSVVIRSASTGLELKRLTGHSAPVLRGAFNPAGTLLATASWDKTVRLWGIEPDTDLDGVPDKADNCPAIPNPAQTDTDTDGIGDTCDNCPNKSNPLQEDEDSDGIGDICEYICGDANDDGKINLLDISFIIAYLYRSGPAPEHISAPDVDHSGKINLLDVSYIIRKLYMAGPPFNCP